MKKKFINLLLASVLTVGSAQVFTSCKDNEADLQKTMQYEYESLAARVDANEKAIAGLRTDLEKAKADLGQQIADAKKELNDKLTQFDQKFTEKVNQLGLDLNKLDEKVAKHIIDTDNELKNLQEQITNNFNKITNLENDLTLITNRVIALENAQTLLEGRVLVLEDTAGKHEVRITDLEAVAAALGVDVEKLKADYEALNITVTEQGNRLVIVEAALQQAQADILSLSTDFTNYVAATDGRLTTLETFKTTWETVLPEIQNTANAAKTLADQNAAALATLDETVAGIQTSITELIDADAAQGVLIENLQTSVDEILESLKGFVSSDVFDSTVATINEKIEALQKENEALRQLAMDNYRKSIGYTNLMIEQVLAQMNANDSALQGQIDGLTEDVKTVSEFQKALDKKVNENKAAIEELQNAIEAIAPKLTAINEAISALSNRTEEIGGRITSIVLQGTKDNVFGSLRLPLGIQSNLLVGYLGEVDNAEGVAYFPVVAETAGTYNGDLSNTLTEQEAEKLGVAFASQRPTADVPIQTFSGQFMTETQNGNGYLGHVYATINPSKANLKDVEFNMVNSRGERVTAPLTFVPCDDVLSHGYARSGDDNNFYYAEASVAPEDFNSIRFTFDENLKTTVKDILKAPKASANVQTVAKLGNALYEQFNGFLPAIGIEASWNDSNNGQMKVTSNYGIATATVHPLSFTFLYGVKPGKHIPNLMPQIDKIKEKFQVAFDEIKGKLNITLYDPEKPFTVGSVELQAPVISIDLNPATVAPVVIEVPEIWVEMPVSVNPDGSFNYENQKVYDGLTETIDISKDLNEVINELKANLDASLSGITETFDTTNEQLKELTANIANQVNELLQNMQETVDTTIDDLLADVEGKVDGLFNSSTVNGIINRLDRVINKLNDIMDNANYYLQPTLLYSNNNNYGMISANPSLPSVFVAEKQTVALHVIPTTYTYETVAPAAKKYVAVTRAWRNGDANQTNIDHVFAEANNRTGKSTNMNKVLNGPEHMVFVTLQKGYTYEVFYQAMDYSGYVSGRKYYITVK